MSLYQGKWLIVFACLAGVFGLPVVCSGVSAPPTETDKIATVTGGNAADFMDASMPPTSPSHNSCTVLFRVVRSGSMSPVAGGFQLALDKTVDLDHPASYQMGVGSAGRATFSGGGLIEVSSQLQNGVLRIDNAPAQFDLEMAFGAGGSSSGLIYRQCFGPQTALLYVVKNLDNLSDGTNYWLWVKSGKYAAPTNSAASAANSQSLPSELPLPVGATVTRVEHVDFGQDEFAYHNSKGISENIKAAGHHWRAFLKGDQASLGVPAWRSALEPAGWEVLNPTPGNTVARHGDWWAKIGLDRLVLVQRVEAEALQLTPPGDKVEELTANQDVPYVTPLPNTSRKAWKTEDFFELKGNMDAELRMLGPAIYLRYDGTASLSSIEIQTRYTTALQKAGWDVVRSDSGGITGAHYTQNSRDIWAKITPLPGGSYAVEVADLGAAAGQDKLAKTLNDEGHVALYGIYFDTDKATLRPDSEATLVQVQKLLAAQPAMRLEIQGHTDNTGTRPHNDTLSQERSAAVKAWLVAHGIAVERLTAKGYADTKPVAENNTPQGRALNRRVELAKP